MNKQVVSVGEKKVYFFINTLHSFEIRKTPPQDDWCIYPPYVVNINGSEEQFLYNGEKFYLEANNKKTQELMKQHAEEAEAMKAEWKTEEEIQTAFAGKWITFVDRIEYIIHCDWLQEKLQKAIETL